jgi:hypothetical protein
MIKTLAASPTGHLTSVLSTVNAPYAAQLTAGQLAACLGDIGLAKTYSGQVSSFFSEVPLEHQLAFAEAHDIDLDQLKSLAREFCDWSGESYKLVA